MINFFKEYIQFLKERKKMFLIPIMLFILVFGSVIFFASSSAVSPFIYTLF